MQPQTAFSSVIFLNGFDNAIRTFVRQMVVHNKQCVNHAGNPEQQRQENTDNALNGFAAQEYRQWRQQNSQYVSHGFLPLVFRVTLTQSIDLVPSQ